MIATIFEVLVFITGWAAAFVAGRLTAASREQFVRTHTYRNRKHGTLYEAFEFDGPVLDCTNCRVGTEVVVYTRNGAMYVREKKEFTEKFDDVHGADEGEQENGRD